MSTGRTRQCSGGASVHASWSDCVPHEGAEETQRAAAVANAGGEGKAGSRSDELRSALGMDAPPPLVIEEHRDHVRVVRLVGEESPAGLQRRPCVLQDVADGRRQIRIFENQRPSVAEAFRQRLAEQSRNEVTRIDFSETANRFADLVDRAAIGSDRVMKRLTSHGLLRVMPARKTLECIE